MYPGERFNAITHLVGTVLALIGTSAAVTLAARQGGTMKIVAVSVYGGMLVVLYLSSTLYHSLRGKAKQIFHVFDHCSIYLLIAGTYTPFTLTVLRGPWGWWLFGIVWTLAILGVAKDVFFRGRYRAVSVVLYLLMGWMVVAAFEPLQRALPSPSLVLLAAGGIIYTVGVVFFALSKRVVHMHGVWHLFVIAGSVCHYFAVVVTLS
ncbi:MAG: hemolysin III family protein [Acidobacteriota bacterium]